MIAKGSVERIGSSEAVVRYTAPGKGSDNFAKPITDHKQAIETAFQCLTGEHGVISSPKEIEAVGHRMVHGGEAFTHPALIDDEVVSRIEACFDLAPLHNPHNLKGYFASKQHLPDASHVAVFDTSFHHTMPPKAFLYGIPYAHYKQDKVRRYGFHGVSHRYVSYRFAQLHGTTRDKFKLITCHLGNGCSVAAIDHGRSIDTSMGFTPLEGLLMGTRSGSLDPGVVFYLVGKSDMKLHDVEVMLNRHSGLLGLSGVSNDMRDLIEEAEKGNVRAQLALDVFCYQARRYFGAYLAALNGADAIIFMGGIGENAAFVRNRICENLDQLGDQVGPSQERHHRGWQGRRHQHRGFEDQGLGYPDQRGTGDRARHPALHLRHPLSLRRTGRSSAVSSSIHARYRSKPVDDGQRQHFRHS